MQCIKCKKEIPDGSLFCNWCGKKQETSSRNPKKRGNGQGSVYRMPSGTWTAEATLGYYQKDGKNKRKRIRKYGFRTKKEALDFLAELQNGIKPQKHVTFGILWERFQNVSESLSKTKQSTYRGAWKKIHDSIEYRWIDDMTVSELQEITDTCGNSYCTKKQIKNLLSHFYKLAIRDDIIDRNKALHIQLPKYEKSEREILTEAEIEKLWNDFHAEPSAITAQMLLMLYTGIRPGELMTILKENVHLEEHYMTGGIKTEKGKRRKIILPDKIIPVLKWMIQHENKNLIAYYGDKSNFYDIWREKRKVLQIREVITPYCCRHTYITRLTALKVSPAMLKELAGHEDYDITLEYTHLSIADRLEEVNKLK